MLDEATLAKIFARIAESPAEYIEWPEFVGCFLDPYTMAKLSNTRVPRL